MVARSASSPNSPSYFPARVALCACALLLFLPACGDDDDGARFDAGTADLGVTDLGATIDGGSEDADVPDAGSRADGGDDGGVTECTAAMCDDGVACTTDRCDGASCVHEPDNLACAAGTYCDPGTGCAAPVPCASDEDCADAVSDPCIAAPRCDARTRACVYARLDGDGDSFAPPVCGGTDCNDGDGSAHPMGIELCDGVDDDCDGAVDTPLAEEACTRGETCGGGACSCVDSMCPGPWGAGMVCANLQSDPTNCGVCGANCGFESTCVSGECACAADRTYCYGGCVDLQSSEGNCGACGAGCPIGAECLAGECECPAATSFCPGLGCVNLQTDLTSCGACGRACPYRAECNAGVCSPDVPWLTWWQGTTSYVGSDIFNLRGEPVEFAVASADRIYVRAGAPSGNLWREFTGSLGNFGGVSAVDVASKNTVWLARGSVIGRGSFVGVAAMAPTSTGGVVVLVNHVTDGSGTASFLGGTGAPLTLPSRTFDVTAVVLDASGAILSHTTYGGAGGEVVTRWASRGSRLWVVGTTSEDFTLGGATIPAGPWLARLEGGVLAAATALPVEPSSISVAPNGTVLIGGSFTGTLSFGATTLTTRPRDTDVYIARYGLGAAPVSAFSVGALGADALTTLGAGNDRGLVDVTELGVSAFRDDGSLLWSRGAVDARGGRITSSGLLVRADGSVYLAARSSDYRSGGIALDFASQQVIAALDPASGDARAPLYWTPNCPSEYCGWTRLDAIDTGSVYIMSTFGPGSFAGTRLAYETWGGGLLVGRVQ